MFSHIRFFLVFILFHPVFSIAQNLIYSPLITVHRRSLYEVAGKAGDYYWVARKPDLSLFYNKKQEPETALQSLEVFDGHLNLVRDIPVASSPDLKRYLVAGLQYFDEILLSGKNQGSDISINRFTPDGDLLISNKLIHHFSFSEPGSRFLLVRSEDRSKLLLLAFESLVDKAPRLHALLFDQDWKLISSISLENESIAQPLIQDDFSSTPLESFDHLPLQLADNGDWFMTSPSRTSNNYLLFHFVNRDQQLLHQEIRLSGYFNIEDISLSVDEVHQQVAVGILSNFSGTTLKKIRAIQYSISERKIFFDSSYQFNTIAGNTTDRNLTKEYFTTVPEHGFMLFKEYGRPKDEINIPYTTSEQLNADLLTTIYSLAGPVLDPLKTSGYAFKPGLNGIRPIMNGSHLAIFSFPANHVDSTWSGIMNTEGIADLNGAALSYFILPLKNKIYILYNDLMGDVTASGTATTLNLQGQLLDDAVYFWKIRQSLHFQGCRQITLNELAVPYAAQRPGFAIIRF